MLSYVNLSCNIIFWCDLGTDKGKIIERLRYEMLALLTTKEEDVATTLLMLPFALNRYTPYSFYGSMLLSPLCLFAWNSGIVDDSNVS